MDTTEQLQPIIQFLPEEYQGMVMTCIGLITAFIGLYALIIAPLMKKFGAEKTADAITNGMVSKEQIGDIVNKALALEKESRLKGELSNWRFKLAYATDESRPIIEAEITRVEEELRQCSNL
jgi:hypothetical protein